MKYVLRIRKAARRDIVEAHAWYADRSPAAAEQFMEQIESAFGLVAEHPLMYAVFHHETRRALLRRFPYAIYFLVDAHRISVLRVLHQARDPRMIEAE